MYAPLRQGQPAMPIHVYDVCVHMQQVTLAVVVNTELIWTIMVHAKCVLRAFRLFGIRKLCV